MQRGLYIAATGMMVQRRLMENVTQNITNVETTGYKKNNLVTHSFDSVMIERINDEKMRNESSQVGPLSFGTLVDQVYQDFTQGSLEPTDRNTDMAVLGEGFFVLDTPAGQRYTRAGGFTVDATGFLCDHGGNYVMGQNGRIPVGAEDFSLNEDGSIIVNGEHIDRLLIVEFEDNDVLRSQGGNLFLAEGQPLAMGNYSVRQGVLENSNADVAREMVNMLTTYRSYEANQKILTMIDETLGKAANEIGGLR